MVFLIDDLLEIGVVDLVTIVGAEVIEGITGTAVSAGALVSETFNSLLGEGGMSVVMDFFKIGSQQQVASNILSIGEMGGIELKTAMEDGGLLLWEAQPEEVKAVTSQNVFVNKFKELGASLLKQGVNLKDPSGMDLLKKIATSAINLGKNGAKKALVPGIIAGGVASAFGADKIYNKFKKKSQRELKLGKARNIKDGPLSEIQRFPK